MHAGKYSERRASVLDAGPHAIFVLENSDEQKTFPFDLGTTFVALRSPPNRKPPDRTQSRRPQKKGGTEVPPLALPETRSVDDCNRRLLHEVATVVRQHIRSANHERSVGERLHRKTHHRSEEHTS